jgi:hypothetical protein
LQLRKRPLANTSRRFQWLPWGKRSKEGKGCEGEGREKEAGERRAIRGEQEIGGGEERMEGREGEGGVLITLVLVKGLGEVVDARGHLDALLQDGLLALNAHVARPLDIAREVALGGEDCTANAVVARVLSEKVPVLALPVLGGGLLGLCSRLGRHCLDNLSLRLREMQTVIIVSREKQTVMIV